MGTHALSDVHIYLRSQQIQWKRGSIRSDISRLTHQIYPFFFHNLEPLDRCSLV